MKLAVFGLFLCLSCTTQPNIVPLAPPTVQVEDVGPIVWESDLETALIRHLKSNKPLLVYYFSKTCAACDAMNSVWADPAVKEMVVKHFVPLKMDIDETRFDNELHVRLLPTIDTFTVAVNDDQLSIQLLGRLEKVPVPHDLVNSLQLFFALSRYQNQYTQVRNP